MSVPGDQWPVFLYVNSIYDSDHPWLGLLRSAILLRVCISLWNRVFNSPVTDKCCTRHLNLSLPLQALSTRSHELQGLAMLGSMVWLRSLQRPSRMLQRRHDSSLGSHASLRSWLTFLQQVRFALSSSPVFSRTDTTTDSERFYSSVLSLLTDPEEQEEIDSLMLWWNRWYSIIGSRSSCPLFIYFQTSIPWTFLCSPSYQQEQCPCQDQRTTGSKSSEGTWFIVTHNPKLKDKDKL